MCSKNKGADQLHGYRKAGLCLSFRICRLFIFRCSNSFISKCNNNSENAVQIYHIQSYHVANKLNFGNDEH